MHFFVANLNFVILQIRVTIVTTESCRSSGGVTYYTGFWTKGSLSKDGDA